MGDMAQGKNAQGWQRSMAGWDMGGCGRGGGAAQQELVAVIMETVVSTLRLLVVVSTLRLLVVPMPDSSAATTFAEKCITLGSRAPPAGSDVIFLRTGLQAMQG